MEVCNAYFVCSVLRVLAGCFVHNHIWHLLDLAAKAFADHARWTSMAQIRSLVFATPTRSLTMSRSTRFPTCTSSRTLFQVCNLLLRLHVSCFYVIFNSRADMTNFYDQYTSIKPWLIQVFPAYACRLTSVAHWFVCPEPRYGSERGRKFANDFRQKEIGRHVRGELRVNLHLFYRRVAKIQ